ncbi:hypothetical protein [Pseudomonas auratipiscis]|uniref:DUF2798 domain-containing protein n=1 Tax=Pseudomonas auratipiscis TaxID=3115853 RepID=A0AB35WRX0_9PSED|nr:MULTISPECIES: hypothetical protein [unclassified Pseudomonas]MEE1866896.1 hypothetical protein [Pseudomonas sp. 120P]MEE1960594.1 hypothetical protein [Pseudomonas sp. 119P]
MNAAQKNLIEKTLGVVGYLLLVIMSLIITVGFIDYGKRFVGYMFDADEFAVVIWPLAAGAVASLWVRSFIRAGKTS